MIYISHFLKEIRRVCDSYTVLRDGETVDSGTLAGTSEAHIVSLMVGRAIDELYPSVPHTPGEIVLSVSRPVRRAKAPRCFVRSPPRRNSRPGRIGRRRTNRAAALDLCARSRAQRPRASGHNLSQRHAQGPHPRRTGLRLGRSRSARGWRKPARSPTTSPTAGCLPTAAGAG